MKLTCRLFGHKHHISGLEFGYRPRGNCLRCGYPHLPDRPPSNPPNEGSGAQEPDERQDVAIIESIVARAIASGKFDHAIAQRYRLAPSFDASERAERQRDGFVPPLAPSWRDEPQVGRFTTRIIGRQEK